MADSGLIYFGLLHCLKPLPVKPQPKELSQRDTGDKGDVGNPSVSKRETKCSGTRNPRLCLFSLLRK